MSRSLVQLVSIATDTFTNWQKHDADSHRPDRYWSCLCCYVAFHDFDHLVEAEPSKASRWCSCTCGHRARFVLGFRVSDQNLVFRLTVTVGVRC